MKRAHDIGKKDDRDNFVDGVRMLAGYFLTVPAGGALMLLESQDWSGLAQIDERGEGTYEAFEESLAGCGATWHHIPNLVFYPVQLQGLGHFFGFHGWREVSLVYERVRGSGQTHHL